jgi:hypothetical protein
MNTQLIAVIFVATLAGMLLMYIITRKNKNLARWLFVKSLRNHDLLSLCRAITPVGYISRLEDLAKAVLMEISLGRSHYVGLVSGILEKGQIHKMNDAQEIMESFARQFIYCFKRGWIIANSKELDILLSNYHEANFRSIAPGIKWQIVSSLAEAIIKKLVGAARRRKVSDWDFTILEWVLDKHKVFPYGEQLYKDLSAIHEELVVLRSAPPSDGMALG